MSARPVRRAHLSGARATAGGASIVAWIHHVSFAGPFVQVQLTRADSQEPLEAALTRERYRELALKVGDAVYVRFRNARMFVEDYSI